MEIHMDKYFTKNRIKEIFDNLRNLGLSALLLAVGLENFEIKPDDWFREWYFVFMGSLLSGISIFLLTLNAKHAVEVLSLNETMGWGSRKRLIISVVLSLYLLSLAPIYSYSVVNLVKSNHTLKLVES